jgi:anti-sigma regulatory factor (Ser/Thr protein kinase)
MREMTMTATEDLEWTALPVDSLARSWRILLASRLEQAGVPAAPADDILLSASELITNACQYAPPSEQIALRVRFGVSWVCVGVWDACNEPPRPRPLPRLDGDLDEILADLSEDGRGLQIVNALTIDHNFEPTPPKGKWMWCQFAF